MCCSTMGAACSLELYSPVPPSTTTTLSDDDDDNVEALDNDEDCQVRQV